MGLETGTYINDLVTSNPVNADQESQGAAHLRLIKTVLQNTFPTNASRAWPFPQIPAAKTISFAILAADFNKTFLVDTTAGIITATLPVLASTDQGWICSFIKTNTGTNPLLIAPPSGSITSGEVSGLAQTRRCIPGHKTDVIWSGSAYFATRIPRVPIGSIIDLALAGTTLPVGYEWPNGQTLASASANYPEYFVQNGNSGVTFDLRDKCVFGGGNMGGLGDRGLITVAGGNWDGTTQGNGGGAQNHVLTTAELAAHTHPSPALTDNGHTHTVPIQNQVSLASGGSPGYVPSGAGNPSTSSNTAGITIAANTGSNGSGTAHTIMPPGISLTKVLVVE